MMDRRRRRFETRLFMTLARGDLLGSKVNVPSERNHLKSSRPGLALLEVVNLYKTDPGEAALAAHYGGVGAGSKRV